MKVETIFILVHHAGIASWPQLAVCCFTKMQHSEFTASPPIKLFSQEIKTIKTTTFVIKTHAERLYGSSLVHV